MAMSFAVSSRSSICSLRSRASTKRVVTTRALEGDYVKSLSGISAPFPEGFDPLSLSKTASEKDIKRWRESELHHGRIAMLAALGFLVGEQVQNNPSLDFLGGRISGPGIYHWQQTSSGWQNALIVAIGVVEGYRITIGWKTPTDQESFQALNDNYAAGDLGFDPLGLKPADKSEYKEMQTKELNNGRLAMIAVLAIVVQELVYQKDLLTGPGLQAAFDAAPLDPKDIKSPPLPIDYPGKGSGLPSLVKPPTSGPGVSSVPGFSKPPIMNMSSGFEDAKPPGAPFNLGFGGAKVPITGSDGVPSLGGGSAPAVGNPSFKIGDVNLTSRPENGFKLPLSPTVTDFRQEGFPDRPKP